MKYRIILFLSLSLGNLFSQVYTPLKVGDKAPDFILTVDNNAIQSFIMPYMKRIALLHFWSTESELSKTYNRNLDKLYRRYRDATFSNAEGFEIIAIAVQSDMNTWKEVIKSDSLGNFTHGIAPKKFDDEVCLKYNVQSVLPADILVDETGKIISIDPRFVDIENRLDERRNFHPNQHDVVGVLAQLSNKDEVLKYSKLYLFNIYGDSLASTVTNEKGEFTIHDIKLNQPFSLKVDNKFLPTNDPLALYAHSGEYIMNGSKIDGGFLFEIPPSLSNKLGYRDPSPFRNSELGQIDVIKTLHFSNNGKELTPKDQEELKPILVNLQKNSALKLEFMAHTDLLVDATTAQEITNNQMDAIRAFFEKKGIHPSRINGNSMGNNEPRKHCEGISDCTDADQKLNRRVEFVVYKEEQD